MSCEHLNIPQEPEYPQADVYWNKNNYPISVDGLGRKKVNSTITVLNFTITPQTVGNYSCFLVNAAKRGIIVESDNVTIRLRGEYNGVCFQAVFTLFI